MRFFGSLDYALAHVGGNNSVLGLIRKSVQIPLAQPVALTLSGIAIAASINARGGLWQSLSIVLFAGSVVGMTATMGGNGSLGQLALPTLAGVAIGCAELVRRSAAEHAQIIGVLAGAIVLGFTVPHVLNAAAAATESMFERSQLLVKHGPYVRYLSMPEGHNAHTGPTQYQMLADGIDGLNGLGGDASQWGIVANGGLTFEHAMRAKPVAGYPLWQRKTAPEFAPDRPLSDEVDVIMISRLPYVSDHTLRSKMTGDFSLCARTNLWEIYTHERLSIATCLAN